jgi:hypothetical protein
VKLNCIRIGAVRRQWMMVMMMMMTYRMGIKTVALGAIDDISYGAVGGLLL